MKKVLIAFMVMFCLAANAHDGLAAQLAKKVWGVDAQTQIQMPERSAKAQTTMAVDVACNAFTMAVGVIPDSLALGQTFIISGYIYPAGTFEEHGADSGINADGTAEFPDLVIGTWICRGNLYTPSAYSSTIFTFNDGSTITTAGIETSSLEVFTRAITGGTGPHAFIRGQQNQQVVGFNATQQANFWFDFQTVPDFNFKR